MIFHLSSVSRHSARTARLHRGAGLHLFRSASSNTAGATPPIQFDSPLELLQGSTKMIREASERLVSIGGKIDEPVILGKGTFQERPVSFKDIVLHSRDATPEEFHQEVAVKARAQVLEIAEAVESDLKEFSSHYTEVLKPVMDEVAKICRDMPCGGVSLEVDRFKEAMGSGQGKVSVEGGDTPCGKFTTASLAFLQTTYDTREQVTLASRSALILRLAKEFNKPLTTVRKDKDGGQQRMGQVFADEVVPTPWIRSNEEYQEFFKIKEQIEQENKN